MRFQVATRAKENLNTPKFTPRWRGPVIPPHAPCSGWGWPGFGVRRGKMGHGTVQGRDTNGSLLPGIFLVLNNGVLGLNKQTNKYIKRIEWIFFPLLKAFICCLACSSAEIPRSAAVWSSAMRTVCSAHLRKWKKTGKKTQKEIKSPQCMPWGAA